MTVVPDHVTLASTAHVALSCVTDASGQTHCTGASAGLFAGLGIVLFIYLGILVLSIVAAVKVVTKAGYPGWWVLIAFVPLVGTVFVFIFAFSTWPVTKEVQRLRAQVAGQQGYGGYRGAPGDGAWPGQSTYGVPGPAEPGAGAPAYSATDLAPLPTFGAFLTEGKSPVVAPPGAPADVAAPAADLPPAGWYPNPGDATGQLRYWDGSTWTDELRPS